MVAGASARTFAAGPEGPDRWASARYRRYGDSARRASTIG
jgi:hypothetical protein